MIMPSQSPQLLFLRKLHKQHRKHLSVKKLELNNYMEYSISDWRKAITAVYPLPSVSAHMPLFSTKFGFKINKKILTCSTHMKPSLYGFNCQSIFLSFLTSELLKSYSLLSLSNIFHQVISISPIVMILHKDKALAL